MIPWLTRILFATDFSDCAREAQDYAVFLARASGAEVDVVHVFELYPGLSTDYPVNRLYLDQLHRETDEQLEQAVIGIRESGVGAKSHQIIGMPSLGVIELAKSLSSNLIVLGTQGRTGWERVLLGSTAERVVAGAPCPVLTVRQANPKQHPEHPAVERLLIPTDFSDCSLDALYYGLLVARQLNAAATVLHVLEPVSYGLDFTLPHRHITEKSRAEIESRIAGIVEAFMPAGVSAHSLLRGGTPAESILSAIPETGCDLIVMGTHGRKGLSHLVSGSVAEAVLRRAAVPVLTMKCFPPGLAQLRPSLAERR